MTNANFHFRLLICVRDWRSSIDSGDCIYNGRMSTRFRNACALVIALLVLAVSSQSAICESACSSASQQSCCPTASGPDAMEMSGGHCPGDMSPAAMLADGSACHHAALVATEASAFTVAGFNGVRWATRVALPSAVLRDGNRYLAKAPPLRRMVFDLRSVSLRV